MKLRHYLAQEGISQKVFAEQTGLTPATVSGLCSGARIPQQRTLEVIAEHTRGLVGSRDFERPAS